ncbi:MAG TPA: tryptophan 7-halogenase, partial [Sphingomicrobium sp.]|nr:tryptophan 7-halogenase [Sphingomicrobium sp.]
MSSKAGAMREIVVVGGGIVGWSAAVALKRRLPALEVTLLPVEPPPDALADRMVPTLPSIVEFHHDVGLTEADTVVRAASGFRLGTRFEGWAPEPESYVHAYGEYGLALGPVPFHQHWLRAAQGSSVPRFDRYSAAAALASSGRFIHPQDGADPLASSFGYGLHIEPPSYCEMMRAFALHLGVRERPGQINGVRLRSIDGFVEALAMEGGEELGGDLFVDASGPAAIIRSAIDPKREDWSKWLPADRILIAEQPGRGEATPLDRCVAEEAGWWWEVKAPSRTSHGLVYSSRHLSEDESARLLRKAAGADPAQAAIALAPGRFGEPWLRNCVAIGDSAIAIEPLEWTNLHLAHSAIDRMVAMMPDRDCNPVELWD